jgi:hypothetical protein
MISQRQEAPSKAPNRHRAPLNHQLSTLNSPGADAARLAFVCHWDRISTSRVSDQMQPQQVEGRFGDSAFGDGRISRQRLPPDFQQIGPRQGNVG